MTGNLGKNLQGKTIAVYGASSNIGRKFTQEAATRGATVIAIARNTNKVPSHLKRGATGSIEIVQADLTQKKDVRKALRGKNVDTTINFAVDFSPDFTRAKAVNVIGEQYVLDASVEYGVKRHIYISTVATQTPKPNAYRDTKLEAEDAVKIAGEKHDLEWMILRYSNVLGTQTWDQPFKIVLPFLRLAVPKVPTDAKEAAFFYVTIDTVINATLAAVEARPNQIITVFDGKTTIREYLSIMEKVYAIKGSFLPGKPLKFLAKYFGKYFPLIDSLSAGVDFMAHPPEFENETMRRQLKLRTRNFQSWIEEHFPQNIKKTNLKTRRDV